MHPLVEDLTELKEVVLESKVNELSKKYWQTSNPDLKLQIASVLEVYHVELQNRRAANWAKEYEKRNKNLDDLIQIN